MAKTNYEKVKMMDINDYLEKKKEVEEAERSIRKAIGDPPIMPHDTTGYERFVSQNVFIRTVTHHYSGRCIETTGLTLTLEDAAWIADDGRFHESLKDPSNFNEVEPYPEPVTINLYSILDVTRIPKLITKAK